MGLLVMRPLGVWGQYRGMEGNVIRYRQRRKRPDLRFYGAVVLVAVIAFSATLFWQSDGGSAVMASARSYDFSCDVAYVNDGDTLRCEDGTRVRFHAIAARETDGSCSPGHPCPSASASASKAALERLAGRRINCVQTGTSYRRMTAICWNSAGVEINCAMVQSGAASLWDRFNRQKPICRD